MNNCAVCQSFVSTSGECLIAPYTMTSNYLHLSRQDFICADCLDELPLFQGPVCRQCSRSLENISKKASQNRRDKRENFNDALICSSCSNQTYPYNRVVSVGKYSGVLKELISRFKYSGERELASLLGKLLALRLMRCVEEKNYQSGFITYIIGIISPLPYDLIVPIPLSRTRLLERGFNQAELLARVVSEELKIP